MSGFRVKPIVRLQTDSDVLNRIQDQHVDALNPLLRSLAACPVVVTGATGGNAALESLLSVLEAMGLITDETT